MMSKLLTLFLKFKQLDRARDRKIRRVEVS